MSSVDTTIKIYEDGRETKKLGPLSYTSVNYTKELIITIDADASNVLLNLPASLKLLRLYNLSSPSGLLYEDGASDKYDFNNFAMFSNTSTQFRIDNTSSTAAIILKAVYVE